MPDPEPVPLDRVVAADAPEAPPAPWRPPPLLYPLLAILAIVLYLALEVFHHFLAVTAVAAAVAVLLAPLNGWLVRRLGGRSTIAALIQVGIVTVAVLLPVATYGALLRSQAVALVEWVRPHLEPHALEELWTRTLSPQSPTLQRIGTALGVEPRRLFEVAAPSLTQLANTFRNLVQSAVTRVTTALFQLVLFDVLLFFLLRDGRLLRLELRGVSPLSVAQEQAVADHLSRTLKGVLLATVLVPLAQGLLAIVGFTLFGVPGALFWGALVVFAALIPAVGSPLVWVPVAIWLTFARSPLAGAGMAIYGTAVISTIDNILKPLLLRGAARIHPAPGLLASLGGLLTFGPLGFVLGPIILSLLLSAIRIYRDEVVGLRAPVQRPPAGA